MEKDPHPNNSAFILAGMSMLLLWWGAALSSARPIETDFFPWLSTLIWFLALFLVIVFPRRLRTRAQLQWILSLALICRAGAFAGVYARSEPAFGPALILLLDAGTVFFLAGILRRRRLSLAWSLLYACHPLAMVGAAENGGISLVFLFLVTGALFFYQRRAWRPMYALLGAATPLFPLSVLLTGFLIIRSNARSMGWFFPGLAACLLLINAAGIHPYVTDNGLYAGNPLLLGPLAALVPGFIFYHAPSRSLILGGLLLSGLWYFHPARSGRFNDDPVPGLFFATGLILLMAPRISPAAFILLAPFVVLRPGAAWILLFPVLFFMFRLSPDTGWPLMLISWLPLHAAVILAAGLHWKRFLSRMRPEPCRRISVVIPALNEEKWIGGCIDSIRRGNTAAEIIVVDGGSTDLTAAIALKAGAHVIVHACPFDAGGGRGGQIKAGIGSAKGDVVAIVHADTRVPGGVFGKMLDVLNKNPDVAGGAAGCRFDSKHPGLILIEWLNDARMAFSGLGFGDQVQFFRRRPVVEKNLFPALPLMEDVEFSLRLHCLGRTVFLFEAATVSDRRWHQKGAKNGLIVLARVSAFLLRRLWTVPDTAEAYRRYYRD